MNFVPVNFSKIQLNKNLRKNKSKERIEKINRIAEQIKLVIDVNSKMSLNFKILLEYSSFFSKSF